MKFRAPILLLPAVLALAPLQADAAMIAHYTFNETTGTSAADSVRGAGGVATLVNAAGDNTSWVSGQIGGAIDLDGTNDFFHALDPITTDLANYSVSTWIQRDGGTGWQTFLTSWGSSTSGSHLFTLNNSSLQHYMYGGNGVLFSDSKGTINVDSGWNHVAMTYNGTTGTQTLYLNGTAFAAKTGAPATMNEGTGNATMGIGAKLVTNGTTADVGNSPGYFNGKIDDLAMWNETLTATDIEAIYDNGLLGIAVPEPAAALLGGLGLLTLLRRHRA